MNFKILKYAMLIFPSPGSPSLPAHFLPHHCPGTPWLSLSSCYSVMEFLKAYFCPSLLFTLQSLPSSLILAVSVITDT